MKITIYNVFEEAYADDWARDGIDITLADYMEPGSIDFDFDFASSAVVVDDKTIYFEGDNVHDHPQDWLDGFRAGLDAAKVDYTIEHDRYITDKVLHERYN